MTLITVRYVGIPAGHPRPATGRGALIARFVAALLAVVALGSVAARTCSNQGDLDTRFCDANRDLIADTPADPSRLKDPDTLVFSFTPVEDPWVGTTGYTLQLITIKDSPIKGVGDLKGKRMAHVSPSSNSGDTAPRVLFAAQGVTAGTDYEVLYSGKHDNSIMGVVNGDYDAAPVASNVVTLMRDRGMFKADALRVVYESRPFPGAAFGVAHDLKPELQARIREGFTGFGFAGSNLAKEFKEYQGFVPVDYAVDWNDIRSIQKSSGASYTREGLGKLKR